MVWVDQKPYKDTPREAEVLHSRLQHQNSTARGDNQYTHDIFHSVQTNCQISSSPACNREWQRYSTPPAYTITG